jgi:hypothetical protein
MHAETNLKVPLKEYLLNLSASFVESERVSKYHRDSVAYKCEQFYAGHQQLYQHDDGWWYPLDDGEIYWIVNIFAYHVRANAKEFTRSHPELLFRAMSEDFRAVAASRSATTWWKQVAQRYFTETFLQREGKKMQLHGGAWRYGYWNPAHGTTKTVPRLKTEIATVGEDGYACRQCQATGPEPMMSPDGVPVCPECGNPNIEITAPQDIPQTVQDGEVSYPVGDLCVEQPDGFEMWTQSSARNLDESLWLRRHRRADRARVEYLYPDADLRPFVLSASDDRGQQYQRRSERSYGGADAGHEMIADVRSIREVEFTEDWYQPEVYFKYVVAAGDTLPNGMVVPADVPLVQLFPKGIKVVTSGSSLLDLIPENFRDHFEYIPYDIQPNRFWGKGVEDAVPVQENYNETVSLVFTNMMNCDSPVTVYDQAAIKNPGIPGTPARLIPVGERPPNMSLRDVYATFPGQSLPDEVWNFLKLLKDDMQMIFGAFSTFSGAPDQDVETATGMALLDENSRGLIGMPLSLRAEAEARFAKKCLRLFVENAAEERFITGDYAQLEARYLKGSDIEGDLEVVVKPGSYMPQQEFKRRKDLADWTQMIIQIYGPAAPQILANPNFVAEMSTRFNVPMNILDPVLAQRHAQRILEQFKELAGQFDTELRDPEIESPNPMEAALVIQAAVPVNVWTDNHLGIAAWLQAYANTDEGLSDSALVRQLINDRIQASFVAEGQRQSMMQMLTMQGQMMGAQGAAPGPIDQQGGQGGPPTQDSEGGMPEQGPPQEEASPVGDVPMPDARATASRLPLLANRPSGATSGLG